jgi:hypothetical protein
VRRLAKQNVANAIKLVRRIYAGIIVFHRT